MKKSLLVMAFLVMLPGVAIEQAIAPSVAVASQDNACAAEAVTAGKKLFKKCKVCHVVDKEKNRVGPHLVGIAGRKAGSVKGYRYSKAMKKAAEDGLEWNDENLDKFMAKPRKFIRKTKMAFAGVKKEDQREKLLCYLKDAGGSAS